MVRRVAHLADLHIRRLHRHAEYREVFGKMYKKLNQLKPDLIVIAGDIVHGKLDTSPELTRMVATLFLKLTKIADVIVITGNHDVNMQNKSRIDALSPIIDLVKKIHPNIYYWKRSGKYTYKNIDFGVLSIFDIDSDGNQLTEKLPNPKEMNNEFKIALHHGPVGNVSVDTGFKLKSDRVTVDTFSGYDAVMLGDIHRKQQLSSYNGKDMSTIWYPGSLIQNNFGENSSKGFLLWDLEKRDCEFIILENDYGFKTIKVVDGKIQNKMNFVPEKGNVRIKYWNTTVEQIKDIQLNLRKQYPRLREVKAEKQDTLSSIDKGIRVNKIDIGDVRNIKYQNELIEDFLKRNVETADEGTIKRIRSINKATNNTPEIYDNDVVRNVDWKVKSFEFDNMFSYKEGNKINFERLNNVCGLIGPNHSGKSSLISALSYTIFDTCDRTFRSLSVLNRRKKKFKAKLNLEINGEDYWIEREGKLRRRKNRKTGEITEFCPVSVKFYMMEGDEKIDLTGSARRTTQYGSGTNEEIRKLLGTFDDFILTSLSLQTNGANFIDKKQTERKQLLSQFMDIDIFDQLYDIAKEDSYDERKLLKTYQTKNSYVELSTVEQRHQEIQEQEKKISSKLEVIGEELETLSEEKLTLTKKLWRVDLSITDINVLETTLSELEEEKKTTEETLRNDIEYRETLRPLYLKRHEQLDRLGEEEIKESYNSYQRLGQDQSINNGQLKTINTELKSLRESLMELNKYKYDRECKYCLDNASEHISHEKRINDRIDILIPEKSVLTEIKTTISEKLSDLKDAVKVKEQYDLLVEELNRISQDAIKVAGRISTAEEKVKGLKSDIKSSNEKIENYYVSEKKIKENEQINLEIGKLVDRIIDLEQVQSDLEREHREVISSEAVLGTRKYQIEEDIQKMVDCEIKVFDYDIYLMAISKDGVPYELISKTIPNIEAEINEVLDSMMVGFTIDIEMDGKNINTYINYGSDGRWLLDLASGMERFVSNLAIRIGLINVSTLPRPDFLVIDEGWGSLDGENISNLESVFEYLNSQFSFLLIITHIDNIKDFVDTIIPIDVDSRGNSKIIYA